MRPIAFSEIPRVDLDAVTAELLHAWLTHRP